MKQLSTLLCFLVLAQLAYSQAGPAMGLAGNMQSVQKRPAKKWSFSSYNSISANFMSVGRIRADIYSTHSGIQVNRMINNNLFAFGGVSVQPAYTNFRQAFIHSDLNKQGLHPFNAANLGLNPRAELGLGYTNDARTFTISGRVSIQQSNYYFPGAYSIPSYQLLQPFNQPQF